MSSPPQYRLKRSHHPGEKELLLPGHASTVPSERVRVLKDCPIRQERPVIYWMATQHRLDWNFALDRSLEIVNEGRGQDLLILETLSPFQKRTSRHVRFWLDAVKEHYAALDGWGLTYVACCPTDWEAFLGRLAGATAECGALIIDDYPYWEYRQFIGRLAERAKCRVEVIDSCGLLPLAVPAKCFPTARGFRTEVQKRIPRWLKNLPDPRPVSVRWKSPGRFVQHDWWPPVNIEEIVDPARPDTHLRPPFIERAISLAADTGGSSAARRRWQHFMETKIDAYHLQRNHPDAEGTSRLSGHLHFGMISPYELVHDVFQRAVDQGWTAELWRWPSHDDPHSTGEHNWRGLPAGLAAFLDQIIVWRELGFNFCFHKKDYKSWSSLPDWAKRTLEKHRADPRPITYSLEELEAATTHDALWNAAQTELREFGRIHNYMRMLWGKKILEWLPTPELALETMIELNDTYALDGSDPNSYTGICWILGRYDRPWGPERPIFGTVRYMSTASATRKLRVKDYVAKYGGEPTD